MREGSVSRSAGAVLVVLALIVSASLVLMPDAGAALQAAEDPTDNDWSEFLFVFENTTMVGGDNKPGSPYVYPPDGGDRKKNQAWFPGTGGAFAFNDPDAPGMNVHVSCSDVFDLGWATANQPSEDVDTNWRIAGYFIAKYTNGQLTEHCGDTFIPGSLTVIKNTTPETTAGFAFALSGIIPPTPTEPASYYPADFETNGPDLQVVLGNGGSHTWSGLDAGTYTLTELLESNPSGYALDGLSCESDLGLAYQLTGDGALINLKASDNVTCTFANSAEAPGEPAVDIEKSTNGEDADDPAGPQILVGDQVSWTYVVTNIGDVSLFNVTVTDDQGVEVSCPATELAAGASMECTASGTAVEGQYSNLGIVEAFDAAQTEVGDEDPSHYNGYLPDEPSIDIEKATNGVDADNPSGPQILVGSTVTWTYVVTNTGNTVLSDVAVIDDKGVDVSCPEDTLDVGESMTCSASGTATAGQYGNVGTVTAGSDSDESDVSDSDPSHYFGYTQTVTTTVPPPALGGIGDLVWIDSNTNDQQDPGEPTVGGVTVVLYDADTDAAVATQVTDAFGHYLFSDLAPGDYYLVFSLPSIDDEFVRPNIGGNAQADSDADNVTVIGRTPVITVLANVIDRSWDAGVASVAVAGVQITTTTVAVSPETLPFTGANFGEGGTAGIALALLALGGVALLTVRRREEDAVTVATGWSSRLWDVE